MFEQSTTVAPFSSAARSTVAVSSRGLGSLLAVDPESGNATVGIDRQPHAPVAATVVTANGFTALLLRGGALDEGVLSPARPQLGAAEATDSLLHSSPRPKKRAHGWGTTR